MPIRPNDPRRRACWQASISDVDVGCDLCGACDLFWMHTQHLAATSTMSHCSNVDVSEALKKVRYNESVHLTVEDDSSSSDSPQRICLIPCLNQETGGVQFNNLVEILQTNSDLDDVEKEHVVLARELQTKRWFFPMLNDHRRNEQYEKAINAASQALVERWRIVIREEDPSMSNRAGMITRVLDIGSGTGLLAMMAARSFQKQKIPFQVTSIEMSSALATIARRTVEENGLQDVITVKERHSDSIEESAVEYRYDFLLVGTPGRWFIGRRVVASDTRRVGTAP